MRITEECDVIFHNVAQVPLAKNKDLFYSVNIDGTQNIIDSAFKNKVKKLIYTSTSAVFGIPKSNPVTEDTKPTPMEAYGKAKLEAEHMVLKNNADTLTTVVIRPRTILGHGRLGIFQILFDWIEKGYNIPVFDDGHNIYQFVHADDLAEACILAAENPVSGIFNCGADSFGSMRDTLQALCEHAKTGSKIRSLPKAIIKPLMKIAAFLNLSPLGGYHALMYGESLYFDINKAKRKLGWQPKHSSNSMLIESYEWYRQNKKYLPLTEKSHHQKPVKQRLLGVIGKCL